MRYRGIKFGMLWGIISLIIVWITADTIFVKNEFLSLIIEIIALPETIYSMLFIQSSAPGGSFYYSPFRALLFVIIIGALLGVLIETIYRGIFRK